MILASGSSLAGHVSGGEGAQVSGPSCVHQRVRIGAGAFVAAASTLVGDLIPWGLAVGNRARLETLNLRGLRRNKVAAAEQRLLLRTFRYLFDFPASVAYYPPLELTRHRCVAERASEAQWYLQRRAAAEQSADFPRVRQLLRFVMAKAGAGAPPRHLCKPSARVDANAEQSENAHF